MNSKYYIKPEIEIVTVEIEGVIANSPTPNVSDTPVDTDARSRRRGLWDEFE